MLEGLLVGGGCRKAGAPRHAVFTDHDGKGFADFLKALPVPLIALCGALEGVPARGGDHDQLPAGLGDLRECHV